MDTWALRILFPVYRARIDRDQLAERNGVRRARARSHGRAAIWPCRHWLYTAPMFEDAAKQMSKAVTFW